MTDTPSRPRSVIVEREFPHPPERVWRALTQPHLIEQWLMKNNFRPVLDHRFELAFEWGAVECRVREIEPLSTLSYTWTSGELDSVVTWTLEPTPAGTRLRMEQTGFPDGAPRYLKGATAGWPRFLDAMEDTLERMDESAHPAATPENRP